MRRRKAYFTAGPDDPAPIVMEVRRRIAFSEVDAMAVAWHGNYLRFFEAAHSELMAKIGLTFAAYAEHRLAAPVVQSHVDYFSPLLLDEVCVIRAELFFRRGQDIFVSFMERVAFHDDADRLHKDYSSK